MSKFDINKIVADQIRLKREAEQRYKKRKEEKERKYKSFYDFKFDIPVAKNTSLAAKSKQELATPHKVGELAKPRVAMVTVEKEVLVCCSWMPNRSTFPKRMSMEELANLPAPKGDERYVITSSD